MTIINQISVGLLSILCLGCSAQSSKTKEELNCSKVEIASETEYFGDNTSIAKNFSEFNSSNNSLDIIRIISKTGYDRQEKFMRVYVKDGKVYFSENGETKERTIDPKKLTDIFEDCDGKNIMITCGQRKSQSTICRLFVKKGNKVVMTFTSNASINDINKNLIAKEIKYFEYLDTMR
ncbi:MAG: hypothetical protein IR153_10830 [Flavobacterium sp.]|nr:hypothetical protein [Flavobacterium sp.]